MGDTVPDSWDQGGNDVDVVETKLAATSLNPNAGVFVPGKNVHAAEFVPGGSVTPNDVSRSEDSPRMPCKLPICST